MMTHNDESHYTTNVQVVLGQVATGGGAEYLEEQLACLQIPSVTKATFIQLECHLGSVFDLLVSDNLLAAGKEERDLAIANMNITVEYQQSLLWWMVVGARDLTNTPITPNLV